MVKVGFGQTDITPPLGAEMPGGMAKRFATGVHDPLWAVAAVFDNGKRQVALVGVDALSVKYSVVAKARGQIADQTGIPKDHILVAASHTHNGGPTCDVFRSESDPQYNELLSNQIAAAVIQAWENRQPAQMGFGVGKEDSIAFNRRFKMRDGTEKTHPGKGNPDIVSVAGPTDPDVCVIAARTANLNVNMLGVVVNYTCHCTTLGGTEFSADYVYYLREAIRRFYGDDVHTVFLNGACGDVTQVDNLTVGRTEFGEVWAKRMGTVIGGEVIKVVAKMDWTDEAELGALTEQLELPLREVPDLDAERPSLGLGAGDVAEQVYAEERFKLAQERKRSPFCPVQVQAMRIGAVGIAANPAEYFCQFGLDIKAASPLKPTFVVELANGCVGYVPTPQAFIGGGYEPRSAMSSKLTPEAGHRIMQASLRLLRQLA